MSEEEVRDCLERLIELFRSRAAEVPDEVLEKLSSSGDFRDPCQLELFWMNEPVEYQILVLTHDGNRPDGEIILNGPYSGEEFISTIDEILQEPRWNQLAENHGVIVPEDGSIRRDLILGPLQRAVRQIKSAPFRERSPRFGTGQVLFGGWVFLIDGNIVDEDLEDYIESRIEEAERKASPDLEEESSESEDVESEDEKDQDQDLLSGFGTYIFQPVWIDGPPEKDFEEMVFDRSRISYGRVVGEEFAGNRLLAFRDGSIFVETETKERAQKILNTIFGTAIFFGEAWHAVHGPELMSMETKEDGSSRHYSGPISMPRSLLSYPESDIPMLHRRTIPKEKFETLVSAAEGIFAEEKTREKSEFLLLALNHHQNGEYTQAFLLSWILIEQHFNQMLDQTLRDEYNVNHDRRKSIIEGHHWFASNKIELLEIVDALDQDSYELVDEARGERNDIVHEMDKASETESQQILELAIELLEEEASTILEDHRDASRPSLTDEIWQH